jgi:hypothetical protein
MDCTLLSHGFSFRESELASSSNCDCAIRRKRSDGMLGIGVLSGVNCVFRILPPSSKSFAQARRSVLDVENRKLSGDRDCHKEMENAQNPFVIDVNNSNVNGALVNFIIRTVNDFETLLRLSITSKTSLSMDAFRIPLPHKCKADDVRLAETKYDSGRMKFFLIVLQTAN